MPDQVDWRVIEREATPGRAVGRLLRDQREARDLSLSDVEKSLRIRQGHLEAIEEGHYTLFAVVADEDAVQTCLDAAESVVGDLIEPHSGVYASWELSTAKGTPSQLHTQAAAS